MDQERLTATNAELEAIDKSFPHIAEIKNDDLRRKVVEALVKLWRESPYQDINDAVHLSSVYGGEDTLVHHTNDVTKLSLSMAQILNEDYGIPVNFDFLIGAAILHDSDIMVLYEKKESEIRATHLGEMVNHGVYGAHIAIEVGLPPAIVHAVLAHTLQVKAQPSTIEGIILQFCDLASYLVRCVVSGHPRSVEISIGS